MSAAAFDGDGPVSAAAFDGDGPVSAAAFDGDGPVNVGENSVSAPAGPGRSGGSGPASAAADSGSPEGSAPFGAGHPEGSGAANAARPAGTGADGAAVPAGTGPAVPASASLLAPVGSAAPTGVGSLAPVSPVAPAGTGSVDPAAPAAPAASAVPADANFLAPVGSVAPAGGGSLAPVGSAAPAGGGSLAPVGSVAPAGAGPLAPVDISALAATRARHPEAIAEAAARRTRRPLLGDSGRLMIVAADHPARGALGVGNRKLAMANRADLLERLCLALSRPGVDGVLATADILDDLLLLGALDGKVVMGSMNRGGLSGATFELDDRFTGHRPEDMARLGFDAGKLLVRIDYDDPGSLTTLEATAHAIDAMAERQLPLFVEPFISRRGPDGKLRNDLSAEAVTKSIAIASGLGGSSAYTWLKVPVTENPDDMAEVMQTSTLPAVLLGGEVGDDQEGAYEKWRGALQLPTVQGLVVGRSLLYPADGEVAAAVDTAVGLL